MGLGCIWELAVLSLQFSCKSKTIVKQKVYLKKWMGQDSSQLVKAGPEVSSIPSLKSHKTSILTSKVIQQVIFIYQFLVQTFHIKSRHAPSSSRFWQIAKGPSAPSLPPKGPIRFMSIYDKSQTICEKSLHELKLDT